MLRRRVRRLERITTPPETKMIVYTNSQNGIAGSRDSSTPLSGGTNPQIFHGTTTIGITTYSGNKYLQINWLPKGTAQSERIGDKVTWTHADVKIALVVGKDVFQSFHVNYAFVKYRDAQGTDYGADEILEMLYGTSHPRDMHLSNYYNDKAEWKKNFSFVKSGKIRYHATSDNPAVYDADGDKVRITKHLRFKLGFDTEYYRDQSHNDYQDIKHNSLIFIAWTEKDLATTGGVGAEYSQDAAYIHMNGYFFYKDS